MRRPAAATVKRRASAASIRRPAAAAPPDAESRAAVGDGHVVEPEEPETPAVERPEPVPPAEDPPSFDHKGCSKCKKKGHGCARCKPFATEGIKGYFWLDGEVVRKIPS